MLSDRLHVRDIRNTSAFRLTVGLGLVFAAALAALIGLVYLLSARELTVRTDRIIKLESATLVGTRVDVLPGAIDGAVARNASGLNFFALQSADGERVAGNLRVPADFPVGRVVEVPALPGNHPPLRLLARRTANGETVLTGRDITPILDLRRRVMLILVASGVAIAVLGVAGAFLLSLAPLRRVRDLQQVGREIAAGRLDRRMPVSRRGDELDLLAGTVNTMVEEVARVVAQVKEVTDAIAHDLRTPLTRVRGRLHEARHLPGAEAALADLDLVLERFAALLRISELEASGRRAGFAPVPLAPLVASVRDLYEPLAEEAGVTLALAGGAGSAIVECDAQLLLEALSNLADNAIKYAGAGGLVTLALDEAADGPVLSVRDDGPGLPAEDRQAVLRRFHRGAAAAGVPGTGLGLSVVAAIVHLHGFTLELGDAEPGLIVRILCRTAERP